MMREFGTQMEVTGLYIDQRKDKILYPRPYFSSQMWKKQREETTLYDGREWRTHYWQIRKETILRYATKAKMQPRTMMYGEQRQVSIIEDISDENVYGQLEEDTWTTRRLD